MAQVVLSKRIEKSIQPVDRPTDREFGFQFQVGPMMFFSSQRDLVEVVALKNLIRSSEYPRGFVGVTEFRASYYPTFCLARRFNTHPPQEDSDRGAILIFRSRLFDFGILAEEKPFWSESYRSIQDKEIQFSSQKMFEAQGTNPVFHFNAEEFLVAEDVKNLRSEVLRLLVRN